MSELEISSGNVFMNATNNTGPRTDPSGALCQFTSRYFENTPIRANRCLRSVTKSSIYLTRFSGVL